MSEEDKNCWEMLQRYDALRREMRSLEDALTQASNEFGWRRGHVGFTRIETMRIMLETSLQERAA